MEDIRRALVLCLVLMAETAIVQAHSVGPLLLIRYSFPCQPVVAVSSTKNITLSSYGLY